MDQRFPLRRQGFMVRLARTVPDPVVRATPALTIGALAVVIVIAILPGRPTALREMAFIVALTTSGIGTCWILIFNPFRNAHVRILDHAIVIRDRWPDLRVPHERLSSLSEADISTRSDFIGFFLGRVHDARVTWFPPETPLRLGLSKGINRPWPLSWFWPLARTRTVYLDPEDRPGFIAALRSAAPHVTIDPSLVE